MVPPQKATDAYHSPRTPLTGLSSNKSTSFQEIPPAYLRAQRRSEYS
jgi:hypothetical protein